MANFCTVADVEEFLQIEIADAEKIASCERAIGEASEAIRNYCHQHIDLVEDDEWIFDVDPGRWNLILPELPVVEVSSVTEDGELLTVDDDYKLANYGQLIRVGQRWKPGVQIVSVVYSHGYDSDDLPDDIVAVATRAASRAYQAGLRADESAGVPGVAAKQLGDFSVSFSGETGGGISEGVLGASAARMLLLSEKDMLNRYRCVLP